MTSLTMTGHKLPCSRNCRLGGEKLPPPTPSLDWEPKTGAKRKRRVTEQSGGGQREGQCRVLHTSIHQSKSLLLIAATEVYEGYKVIWYPGTEEWWSIVNYCWQKTVCMPMRMSLWYKSELYFGILDNYFVPKGVLKIHFKLFHFGPCFLTLGREFSFSLPFLFWNFESIREAFNKKNHFLIDIRQ